MSEEQRQKRLTYFINIAERVQPIFEQYGWKLNNKVPTVDAIFDFLKINAVYVDETGKSFESGRFFIRKDITGIKSVDIQVLVDLSEASWEF